MFETYFEQVTEKYHVKVCSVVRQRHVLLQFITVKSQEGTKKSQLGTEKESNLDMF